MKRISQDYLAGNEAMYLNSAYHTSGMGIIKRGGMTVVNGSGFGVIKKRMSDADNSDASDARLSSGPNEINQSKMSLPDDTPITTEYCMVHDTLHNTLEDKKLKHSADRILIWMKIFPEDAVQVRIKDGWMTLTGKVDWQFQRDVTVAAIGNLYGVHCYSDQITVLHPGQ